MEPKSKMIEVLHDLIEINRDRVKRYMSISYDTSISDLKALFSNMADESRKNITELNKLIMSANLIAEVNNMTQGGQIYAAWKEMKDKTAQAEIQNTLDLCELAESLDLRAYEQARVSQLNTQLFDLILRQEHSLKTSKEVMHAYRKSYSQV